MTQTMTELSPERVLRRFYDEAMGKGDLNALRETVAEDFKDHGETLMGSPQSRDELEAALNGMHSVFPDFIVSMEDVIVDGDMVGVRGRMRCTQKGPFLNTPETGNELSWPGLAMFRVADGKIVERWFNSDSLTIVQQVRPDTV